MGNRDFQDILTDLDDGKVHAQLTENIMKVVRAVAETGKAGELTLNLKFKREKRMTRVIADVKTKLPQPATEATLFFQTDDGDLRREDPRQQKLRHVAPRPTGPGGIKVVASNGKATEIDEDDDSDTSTDEES
jgi:hypothetical protein